jgi:nitrite reductase/ring-hydroxylating ferredoxin subunit
LHFDPQTGERVSPAPRFDPQTGQPLAPPSDPP